MSSLGVMMFGKALIVAVWGGIASAWASFRKERAERGIPLKQDKNGVYVPNDWAAKVEGAARFIGRAFMTMIYIEWVVLICIYIYLKWL
jgi:hypothetical protein